MFEKISRISVASMLVFFFCAEFLPQQSSGCGMDIIELHESMKGETEKEGKDVKGSREVDEYVSQNFKSQSSDRAVLFSVSAHLNTGYLVPVIEGPFLPPELV